MTETKRRKENNENIEKCQINTESICRSIKLSWIMGIFMAPQVVISYCTNSST